jgi:hypothetical protein
MPAPDPPPIAWLAAANRATLTARLLPATVHDVSNALQVMSGVAEMLGFGDDRATTGLRAQSITAQAMSAHASMQALVAFNRSDPFDSQPATEVRTACERALGLRAHALRKLAIAVAISGGEGVSVAGSPLVIQVLLNLVINVEQLSTGRKAATLTIAIAESGDTVTIDVADNGPGRYARHRAACLARTGHARRRHAGPRARRSAGRLLPADPAAATRLTARRSAADRFSWRSARRDVQPFAGNRRMPSRPTNDRCRAAAAWPCDRRRRRRSSRPTTRRSIRPTPTPNSSRPCSCLPTIRCCRRW